MQRLRSSGAPSGLLRRTAERRTRSLNPSHSYWPKPRFSPHGRFPHRFTFRDFGRPWVIYRPITSRSLALALSSAASDILAPFARYPLTPQLIYIQNGTHGERLQLEQHCCRRDDEHVFTTLGQPLEVLKTQMAANRSQTMAQAFKTVVSRGGVAGFYQGLIPWAWIEASTKGAVLIFTSAEIEKYSRSSFNASPAVAGLLGGMGGGIAQAYATMGFCTCMKTVEITRHKQAAVGVAPESTFKVFMDIYRREGIAGINKGVNAVAVRQCTNWGSRMGFARLAEQSIRSLRGKSETEKLGAMDKILASSIGGALATWNQPIEVVRVEMQSAIKSLDPTRPAKKTVFNTLAYVYRENGIKGLYRGVTPRIGLGIWQTVCMVSFADYVKAFIGTSPA